MGIQKDTGIVLRTFDLRRTSRIAVIYTRRFGKISGLFKGFYTHPDYFITSLDVFTVNEFVFYERPSELWLVSAAYLLKDFSFSFSILNKYILASNMAEFIDKTFPLHKPDHETYNLLYKSLSAIEEKPVDRAFFAFRVKVLKQLGIEPVLSQCAVCKKSLAGEYFFSLKSGGFVCRKCAFSQGNTIRISGQAAKIIEFIQHRPFEECLRLNLGPAAKKEVFSLLDKFTGYHLEAKIISNKLLPYA